MYILLSNLSLIDLCLSSTAVPKVPVDIQIRNSTISFNNCLMQMYLFICFSGLETLLLPIMSYDRFVAICLPLSYLSIMTPKFHACLVASSWLFAILSAQIYTVLLVQSSFCEDKKNSSVLLWYWSIVEIVLFGYLYQWIIYFYWGEASGGCELYLYFSFLHTRWFCYSQNAINHRKV